MQNARSARVFLVDDHPIVREGFRHLLEFDSFTITGEAGSGEEALEKIAQTTIDLAIVDISMQGMDGIELTRRLKADAQPVRVLIVSMHDDAYYAEEALDAGADGFVLKDNVTADLLSAVEQILAGRPYICGDMKAKLEA